MWVLEESLDHLAKAGKLLVAGKERMVVNNKCQRAVTKYLCVIVPRPISMGPIALCQWLARSMMLSRRRYSLDQSRK